MWLGLYKRWGGVAAQVAQIVARGWRGSCLLWLEYDLRAGLVYSSRFFVPAVEG
jgi:hypothetical protein